MGDASTVRGILFAGASFHRIAAARTVEVGVVHEGEMFLASPHAFARLAVDAPVGVRQGQRNRGKNEREEDEHEHAG